MELASVVLFWFALALYIGATVLYAYQFILRRPSVGWWARFLTGAGFICQTLSIGANSIVNHGTPLTGSNALILGSWTLVLLYFVMEHIIKIKIYGAFLIPVAVIFMIAGQLLGGPSAGVHLTPVQAQLLKSWRVTFHVALILLGNAAFAFGAVSSMLYLFQDSQFKRHKTSRVTRRLPSLATLQTVARRSISWGLPIYTAGIVLGAMRAIEEAVPAWYFDPRIMLAGIIWVVYAAYLFFVYRHGISSRRAAWLAIAGFVLVIIVAILARTVPSGFHIFGVASASSSLLGACRKVV